jgi:hypothetical protein
VRWLPWIEESVAQLAHQRISRFENHALYPERLRCAYIRNFIVDKDSGSRIGQAKVTQYVVIEAQFRLDHASIKRGIYAIE